VDRARIIVVEDEPLTRATYAKSLTAEGHLVRMASDAFACRAALRAAPADLILLDLGLPGLDGLTFARELRDRDDIGVIVVTSREDADTRIAALDEGADDYVIKPVHLGELAARVRILLRRRSQSRGRRYRLGSWLVDLSRRTILGDDGRTVTLTRGEFDLLGRLVEADGKIVSRELLSEAINRGAPDRDPRSVDALVSRLRRKLDGPDPSLIATVAGFGYRISKSAQPG
jgi:two-component system, OmpR family, torCAD operon response regulator TorR